jgi:hypothetical protein
LKVIGGLFKAVELNAFIGDIKLAAASRKAENERN